MLVQFSVSNFRSIRETITLSLEATPILGKNDTVDQNSLIPLHNGSKLLRAAAIYGANASGKTNVMNAISFMKNFALNSSKESQVTDPINTEPFLHDDIHSSMPSAFEIVFYVRTRKYRYGFEVSRSEVLSEWLYHTVTKRETMLFERERKKFSIAGGFKEGNNKSLQDLVRSNALFLSVLAQFNNSLAIAILKWFNDLTIIKGAEDANYRSYSLKRIEGKGNKEDFMEFLRNLGLDILDIKVDEFDVSRIAFRDEVPEELKSAWKKALSESRTITTIHNIYDQNGEVIGMKEFDADSHESMGTQKIIFLSGPILDSLKNGHVLLVDELDSKMHPILTKRIVSLFNSQKNSNNAQLIFTTHDTNLLDSNLMRRDQIWFTEKDKVSATCLFSLAEYKVRKDGSFEKDYIQGRYGAIPFIGDIERVLKIDEVIDGKA